MLKFFYKIWDLLFWRVKHFIDSWLDTTLFMIIHDISKLSQGSSRESPVEPTKSTNSQPFVFPSVGGQDYTLGRAPKNAKTGPDWAWQKCLSSIINDNWKAFWVIGNKSDQEFQFQFSVISYYIISKCWPHISWIGSWECFVTFDTLLIGVYTCIAGKVQGK